MHKKTECSGPELAKLFGDISVQTIAELAKKNIVIRIKTGVYDRDASTTNYINHLRTIAAGRGGKEGVENLTDERARLAKEQADGHALKNALLRSETLDRGEVETTWSGMLSNIRSGMLAVTPRVQQQIPGLTATEVTIIDREIREALRALGEDVDDSSE